MQLRQPISGIIPPVPTFFNADETLDLATLEQHITWMSEHALTGILVLGSNGEAMHLDDDERIQVITTARACIDRSQHNQLLLAGTAALSTRATIARCAAAATAGADIAVVLPPFAFPTQMTSAALQTHFRAVADASPIPVLLYNMPANTANIDMSAELIITLAQHPNIIGVKDSSGNVVKLATIAAGVAPDFAILAGSGSFLLPALSVGGTGAIAAVANVIPEQIIQLADMWQTRHAASTAQRTQEAEAGALKLQRAILTLNALVTSTYGVAGLKAALEITRGYGGIPRRPLLPLEDKGRSQLQDAINLVTNR